MGEVWAARNERTTRDFAIKFLLPELAKEPEALRRFVREAKATGSLRHPNVVTAMDAGMHEGRPYLVMELLSGESLEARLKRDGRLDALETCILLSQVARALEHAHHSGLVHRDLSSANVFLCDGSDDGPPLVKVLDFGVSKVTGEAPSTEVRTGGGKILGSPQFMSPEQARGDEGVDARTDIWSLGVLAYQCLTGGLPFVGANYNALLFSILHAPHEPLKSQMPELDDELAELVEGCLIKDSASRTESSRHVAVQLEQLALRLSQASGNSRYLPLRRRVDRMRITDAGAQARWIARRALPGRALPFITRVAQNLHALPSSVMLALGLFFGVLVGIGGARWVMPSPPPGIGSAPLPPSACENTDANPSSDALSLGQAFPDSRAARAASKESDLVRAMAKGLDSQAPSGKPRRSK
jgi:serine/threonine-protein kinase